MAGFNAPPAGWFIAPPDSFRNPLFSNDFHRVTRLDRVTWF